MARAIPSRRLRICIARTVRYECANAEQNNAVTGFRAGSALDLEE